MSDLSVRFCWVSWTISTKRNMEVTVLTTEKERKKTRLFDCPIGSQNSVSVFLFYNVIPMLPKSRVTQMDECSKLLQYRSNFLQRPLSCFKRSSEAGFRLFDVKKIYFWKQQCMLLATGKYRIFFNSSPPPTVFRTKIKTRPMKLCPGVADPTMRSGKLEGIKVRNWLE